MSEKIQPTSRSIRLRHWMLCQLVLARRREVARCYVRLDRAKASLESVHRPLRVLESENMWLINERGAKTHG